MEQPAPQRGNLALYGSLPEITGGTRTLRGRSLPGGQPTAFIS